MSSDSEDSEYGPLETTWGTQAPTASSSNNTDHRSKGWDSLFDPNIKTKGELGDGQLHRKGKNFKPIQEDFILAQRLNKPIPKNKMQAAIRETETKLGLPVSKEKPLPRNKKKPKPTSISTSIYHTTRRFLTHSQTSTSSSTNNHRPAYHVEVLSTTRVPQASAAGSDGSSWLQSTLVETPFWEEKKDDTTITAPPTPPSSSPSFISNDNTNGHHVDATYNNNRPPPPPVIKKESSAKQKVDNAWGTNNLGWNSSAQDAEPFSNTGWGDQTVTSTSSGWGQQENSTNGMAEQASGWGKHDTSTSRRGEPENSKSITTTASAGGLGWDQMEEKKDAGSASSWGAWANNVGRGSAPTANQRTKHTNTPNHAIPSSRPSWLNTIPSYDNYTKTQSTSPPPSGTNGSSNRFSDRSRTKYSENAPPNIPKPVNCRPDQVTPIPVATAPPPPPENSILITINVELSETHKVSVDIRELDEPLTLAHEFAKNNNIQSDKVIFALTTLFTSQKELAVKKKQQKLQRRAFNPPPGSPNSSYQQQQQQRSKYYNNNHSNVYTNSSYQQETPHSPPQAAAPFTRKTYY